MAIGEKSSECVATISSSSASASSLSSLTSLSSLFHTILAEINGLHQNFSGFATASPLEINAGRIEGSCSESFDYTREWKCWSPKEGIGASVARSHSTSFVYRQHDHHPRISVNNEVDQEQELHCRHPHNNYRHRHRPSSFIHFEKLHNSLTHHLTVLLVVATLFACFPNLAGSATTDENERIVCVEGISHSFPGATYPRGDIILKERDTLEVYCKLNLTHKLAKGYNASNIDFIFSKADIPRDKLSINVLNETTAVLRVKNMNASSSFLMCVLEKPDKPGTKVNVCQNSVDVGFLPLPVDNFRCIARDWKSLFCSWDLPSNPVPTKYTLTKFWKMAQVSCPNATVQPNSCYWGERTDPHYRANTDPLNFRLNGTNALMPSGITWDYSFSLGQIVIPEKPKIYVIKKSMSEYMLNWTFPNFEFFQYGLVHELKVCCEYQEKCNVTLFQTKPINNKMTPYYETIINLPHAYANYTFTVRLRSPNASGGEEFWSEPDIEYTKTDARAPDVPPETDVGSFESKPKGVDARDVYIYWKSLPDYMKNGPSFKYSIEVFENAKQIRNKPQPITESYAVFPNLNSRNTYRFLITSWNSHGRSENSSEIIVPSINELPPEPKSVSKIDFTNGSFEVSWKQPNRYPDPIVSYTVFRCTSKKPRPYPCEGRLEWDRVEPSKLRKYYAHLSHHQYEFAVSANTKRFASGMFWASCTLVHDTDLVPERLRYVDPKPLSEYEIQIKWNLECSNQAGSIEGFKITYCQVEKEQDEKCKDDETIEAVEGANTTEYRMVKLKPYSFYKVYVSILSGAGESPRSVPVYQRTLQGAPSPAIVSNVSHVTNVSATLHIDSPENPNGILTRYEVYYYAEGEDHERERRIPLEVTNETQSFTKEATLQNLLSNSNYSVRVVACTESGKCSGRSNPYFFVTDIGYTQFRNNPQISWVDGHIQLEWDKPSRIGGPIDYFEILLKKDGETVELDDEYKVEEFHGDESKFIKRIDAVECEPSTNFTAQVRAITILTKGPPIFGPWSPVSYYRANSCGESTSWFVYLTLIILLLVVLVIIIMTMFKSYHYFKRMRESLTIKLPPGLNSELNGFAHKPPPRGRSSENLYDKDTYAYPLQPTSTQTEESKDFLSNSEMNQGEAEESLIEKPFSPSPTNPLLGGLDFSRSKDGSCMEDDENDIGLTVFNQSHEDRHSPPTYKKLGVLSNGSAVQMESMPGPSSQSSPKTNSQTDEVSSSSPSRNASQNDNRSPTRLPPSSPCLTIETSMPNGITRTVPDVLSPSSASPTSLTSNSSLQGSTEASPVPVVQPTPSTSYVRWTTVLPDMRTGEAGPALDNTNRQSPYCQVGILLDS